MIDQTQAVIRFGVDGTIITANENFCKTLEYDLAEIQGKHHRMFVDPGYANSAEYRDFWDRLGRGEPFTDRFQRRCKSGRMIWIQATYAGVRDATGAVATVIKVATDVTLRNDAFVEIAKGLDALSGGDLTYRLPHFGLSDVDDIGTAFNKASVRLADILRNVSQIAQQVRTITGDLEHASSELSSRTTAQAATLEQTAAALEELTTTVRSSTKRLTDAEDLATQTAAGARKSDAVVQRAIDAMS